VSKTAVEQNQMFELRLTLRPRGRDVNLTASVVGLDGTTRISNSLCPSGSWRHEAQNPAMDCTDVLSSSINPTFTRPSRDND